MQVDVIGDVAARARWETLHPGLVAPVGLVEQIDLAATSKGFTGKPWHACARCGWVDREASMQQQGGKWLCVKNGCALEAADDAR